MRVNITGVSGPLFAGICVYICLYNTLLSSCLKELSLFLMWSFFPPGVALTADTKVQRMPSESAAQSLAVALPASQSRYCYVTTLTTLFSMGTATQITEAGIRATRSTVI